MGWLKRWDERNQRRAEFDNYREREDPRWWLRTLGALVGYLFVGRILHSLASQMWGRWVGGALAILLVAGLAVFLVREQRQYHALQARHDDGR